MISQQFKVDEARTLSFINTNKFKSGILTLVLYMPLTKRDYLRALILSGVMRRGTTAHPSMAAINKHLDMLYATCVDIHSSVRAQSICFTLTAEMLEPRFALDGTDISDEVIRSLAEILFTPLMYNGSFSEETIEAEKRFARNMLASEENEASTLVAMRLKELLQRGNEPDAPTLAYLLSEIDSITAEEMTAFHAKLCSSDAKVFYVGSESPEKISDSLLRHMGALKFTSALLPAPIPHRPQMLSEICEQRAVSQGTLCLGFRTGLVTTDPQKRVAIMFNEILGTSPASKLFLGVRERLGLCYYCHSSYSPMTGNISIRSGIDVKNKDATFDAIMSAIDEIKRGQISDAEWTAAQRSLSYSYTQAYDSPYALSSFYLDLFGTGESIEKMRSSVLSVTPDQVCDLANSMVYDTQFFLKGTLTSQEADDE